MKARFAALAAASVLLCAGVAEAKPIDPPTRPHAAFKRWCSHHHGRESRRIGCPRPRPEVAEPLATAATSYTPPAPPAPATSGGPYSIPAYIVECESGGDYAAQNASGAYGAYQIMPGTADAYGCDLSTPAGQDQCAAEIYAAEGAAPWACG